MLICRDHHLRIAALIILGSILVSTASASGYRVESGSTDNTIVLQVRAADELAVSSAELVALPLWLDATAVTIDPGPPQAVVVSFDVDDGASPDAAGVVLVRIDWHGGDVSDSVIRRVPLRVAGDAPAVQRSFAVDECCVPTAAVAHDPAGVPLVPVLLGPTPNPSRSLTSIRFGLPDEGASVTLRVHDVTGRRVATIDAPSLPGGYHQITWDGRSDTGAAVASGLYFYELSTDDWRSEGKLILVR